MDPQEDVNKTSIGQEKEIEKDVQKLTPLGLKKPSAAEGDVESSIQKPALDTFKAICPSIRDYISGYISLADAKAGVLIGVFSGLLSVGISKGNNILSLPIQKWQLFDYLIFLEWVMFAFGIICSLFVVIAVQISRMRIVRADIG